MQYPIYVGESPHHETAHYVVSLMARRNASRPWIRVTRVEAFDQRERENAEKKALDRIEIDSAPSEFQHKEARSAEWQIVTVEYAKARRICGWTVKVGRGKFILSALGIAAQKA